MRESDATHEPVGHTGLEVSPDRPRLTIDGEPNRDHPLIGGVADGGPLIKHALDDGVNFFDTANMYSQGVPARRS